eukprot:Clim_evm24s221 gene=Clim_evmTU24s221
MSAMPAIGGTVPLTGASPLRGPDANGDMEVRGDMESEENSDYESSDCPRPRKSSGKPVKYILVCGGVISGIGKGVITSSLGVILRSMGLTVTAIKIDPYLNIDAGTFSPYEHGETFVLDDGGEVDLDLGNYERFLDVTLHRDNNITTGKVYRNVIERERKGEYLGKTVQVVPHVTDEIQDWIARVSRVPSDDSGKEPDVCVIELGGTIGDIESAPFIEALRQFHFRVGHENMVTVMVSLIPVVGANGEQKTKPTQHSVRELRGLGLMPDIIVCRCTERVHRDVKLKVANFCHVPPEQVYTVHDTSSIYRVPLMLSSQNIIPFLCRRLEFDVSIDIEKAISGIGGSFLMSKWTQLADRYERLHDYVSICVVGKYTGLSDAYTSVIKSLQHAALAANRKLRLEWVEAEHLESPMSRNNPVNFHVAWQTLCKASGILVPGGFGERGTEGKIAAAHWARVNNVPFLGICLGFQIAAIEFARNVLQWEDANSSEFTDTTTHPLVIYMPEISKTHLGGTMRLGARPTHFVREGSRIQQLYGGQNQVMERHRHRYEINPKYVKSMEDAGMIFYGQDERGERMEIMELEEHPYFVGVQYHPEFLTRPLRPSPPFLGLILAACNLLEKYLALPPGASRMELLQAQAITDLFENV